MLNLPVIRHLNWFHPFFFFILMTSQYETAAQKLLKESDGRVRALINHHNAKRADVGVQPLSWSVELAAYAQEWANFLVKKNKCMIMHRPENMRKGKVYGENIYWSSSADENGLLDASESWYSEISLYDQQPISLRNVEAVGHYTQMVWRSTTQVGVGMAVCPSGAIIVVANYSEAGNMIGEKPY
jgi:hypothetical protein